MLFVQSESVVRIVVQFEELTNKWHHRLGMVSDILVVFGDIQRMWSYLEPLFIGSEEVRKELPETAIIFTKLDAVVRQILYDAKKTDFIVEACNKEGLLPLCEEQMGLLETCKKALNDFLDGRRRQFPRFYFMSEADLLDVLSNGSQPHKILVHSSKIFLCVKTLVLDKPAEECSEAKRPKVASWITNNGAETCQMDSVAIPQFDVPEGMTPLEGKAEVYLMSVVQAMKGCLFKLFEGCLDSYSKLERSAWAMEGGGVPTYPAMSLLAVSSVEYVMTVEKVMPKVHSGEDPTALQRYSDEQSHDLTNLVDLTRTQKIGRASCRERV